MHEELEASERRWAQWCAEAMGAKPTKPTAIGWCSWYYDYFWFTGDQVEEYVAKWASLRDDLKLDVFLIDAGYFREPGDWLEPHPRFPKGIKQYAKITADAGFTPGIWIAPFMVGDRSRLYQDHPDWVLHDTDGKPLPMIHLLGESSMWAYRDRDWFVLDTSHPAALKYLRHVFRWLRSYGVKYFKTDFMYWGAVNEIQCKRVVRHRPGKTRAEYFHEVGAMIRKEIGEDSFWSGCGQPLLPSVGLVDGIRISGDVGPTWSGSLSPQWVLRDLQTRNFMHRILFQVDPDCVLLRHFEHELTNEEVTALALYMGMSGGMLLTSDPLHECLPERLELFRFI